MDTHAVRAALCLVALGVALAGCGSTPPPKRQAAPPRHHPAPHHVAVHHVRNHHSPIPILEYHVIGVRAPGAPLEDLYVTPAELRSHVAWLAHHHWHTVSLGAVARFWLRGVALPRKPIVLSFDDGYPGDWRYALPILRAHHFTGVLNLQIGNLVPKHVRELLRAGWEIDAHTFTHPDLTTVDPGRLQREVDGSRRWLRRMFRVAVPAFCYPAGRYDGRTLAAVRRAGYLVAETERPGWASPARRFELSRIRIGPATRVSGLAALLRGP
jgi:peptidoglycan/xylan/chitin deacetylase (PgdA/CDA1 family)